MARKKNKELNVKWNDAPNKRHYYANRTIAGKSYQRTGKSEREVVEKFEQLEQELLNNNLSATPEVPTKARLTFTEVFARFAEAGYPVVSATQAVNGSGRPQTRRYKKTSTATGEAIQTKLNMVEHLAGNWLVDETDHREFQTVFEELDKAGAAATKDGKFQYATSTVTLAFSRSRLALEWAVHERLIETNPAYGVILPTSRGLKNPGQSIPLHQFPDFLRECANHRWATLWLMAVLLGLRPGESRGLRWRNVHLDIDNPAVYIVELAEGQKVKTKKSNRGIALPPLVARALKIHRDTEMLLGRYDLDGHVFRTRNGTVISDTSLRTEFKCIVKKAGILGSNWKPYDARHTFATVQGYISKLNTLSVNDAEALERFTHTMGHERIETTRGYVHELVPQSGHMIAWDKMESGEIKMFGNILAELTPAMTVSNQGNLFDAVS